MNKAKAITAFLLLVLATCSFIEVLNERNNEDLMMFLWGTICMSLILVSMLIKSMK